LRSIANAPPRYLPRLPPHTPTLSFRILVGLPRAAVSAFWPRDKRPRLLRDRSRTARCAAPWRVLRPTRTCRLRNAVGTYARTIRLASKRALLTSAVLTLGNAFAVRSRS